MTDTLEDVDLDVDLGLSPSLHETCCVEPEKFICGQPFHPELASMNPNEFECPICEDLVRAHRCDQTRPHVHCPMNPRRVCNGESVLRYLK